MPYVSIAVTQPRDDNRTEFEDMQDDLLHQLKGLPGFVDGYLMMTTDGTGRVGRVTVWKTRRHADQASQEQDVLVMQSRMHGLIEEEEEAQLEQGFESIRV
jgi:heme-degrading monooxygenase HmoA